MREMFRIDENLAVCFAPGERFHGWVFKRHFNGQWVSRFKMESLPEWVGVALKGYPDDPTDKAEPSHIPPEPVAKASAEVTRLTVDQTIVVQEILTAIGVLPGVFERVEAYLLGRDHKNPQGDLDALRKAVF